MTNSKLRFIIFDMFSQTLLNLFPFLMISTVETTFLGQFRNIHA